MIYGGAYHTPTHFDYPDGGNFLTDGSYLTYEYGPTKGKTYSICVEALSYKLGKMADVDLNTCVRFGSLYRRIVQGMQNALKDKLLEPEKYYRVGQEINEYDKLLFSCAALNNNGMFMIDPPHLYRTYGD